MTAPAADNRPQAPGRRALGVEWAFALLILAGLGYAGWRLSVTGYLPQPFFHDPSDSLMDLYNPAFWAHNPGVYKLWGAVYPPLSFLYLKLTSPEACYAVSPVAGRSCDLGSTWLLLGFYLLNGLLVLRYYRRTDPRTALPRAIAVSLGLPMVYALDRGNLIIPCFTLFVLGYVELLGSTRLRWLSLALAFNLKTYLMLLLLPDVMRRRWRWVGGCLAASVLVYAVSYWGLGAGSPMEILANIPRAVKHTSHNFWNNIYYATTFDPLVKFLGAGGATPGWLSPAQARAVQLGLTWAMALGQVGVAACYVGAGMRPHRMRRERFAALTMAVMFSSFGSSGYAEIFLVFLAFREAWRGPVQGVILTCVYLLCLPLDHVVAPLFHTYVYSYLGHRAVWADHGVAVGQALRPALILVIEYGFTLLILAELFDFRRPGAARPDGPRRRAMDQDWARGDEAPQGAELAEPDRVGEVEPHLA